MKTRSPRATKTTGEKMGASQRLYQSSLSNKALPFASFRDVSLTNEDLDNRSLPRMIFRSPQKKNVTEEQADEIPKVFVEPPILAREMGRGKDTSAEDAAEDEKLSKLSVKQLKERYKQLVERYKNGAETFNKLEKKRVRMTAQLDHLRRQVKDLESEQKIVDAEYERLGLGASTSGNTSPRSSRFSSSE